MCLLNRLVVLSPFLISLQLATAQEAANPVPLKLEVVVAEDAVTAGQRIPVQIKLTNVSQQPIMLPGPKFISGFVTTESKHSGVVVSIQHRGGALGHGKFPGRPLKPGETLTEEVWHFFPETGWHEFKCTVHTTRENAPWFQFWEGQVQSKPLSLNAAPAK